MLSTVNVVWRQLNFCARFASVKAKYSYQTNVDGLLWFVWKSFPAFWFHLKARKSENRRNQTHARKQSSHTKKTTQNSFTLRDEDFLSFFSSRFNIITLLGQKLCLELGFTSHIPYISFYVRVHVLLKPHFWWHSTDTLHKNYASFVERSTEMNEINARHKITSLKMKPTNVSSKLWLLKWPRAFAYWNYHCEW